MLQPQNNAIALGAEAQAALAARAADAPFQRAAAEALQEAVQVRKGPGGRQAGCRGSTMPVRASLSLAGA